MRFNHIFTIAFFAIMVAVFFNSSDKSNTPSNDIKIGEKSKKAPSKGRWPFIKDNQVATEIGQAALRNNIYVVFDGSGSMADSGCSGRESKAEAAKKALLSFSSQIPTKTNLGLLVFDYNGVRETVALSTNNKDTFNRSVIEVSPNLGTPLKTAIKEAYNKLTEQAKKQQGYGNYHLVVVTDGDASTSEDPTYIVDKILDESPIVLHTIGFCIRERHTLNQPGRIIYKSAMNTKDLQTGLSNVLAESPSFVATDFN